MKETTQTQPNMDKLTRRNIRYICFRIQTEILGGAKAEKETEGIMQFVDEVKEHMEEQEDFGGWDRFGKTWDVDDKSPLVAVKRTSSIQTAWNKILKEEAKELPVEKEKQFLTNKLAKKVQKRKKKQPAAPEAEHLPGVPQAQHHLEGEEGGKPLQNNLQEEVRENRRQSNSPDSLSAGKAGRVGKTSFWDKLK